MGDEFRLPSDLILSVVYEIEQEKFLKGLPGRVFVTIPEIVQQLNKKRAELSEDYGLLNLSELRRIVGVDANATLDQCLDAVCSRSNMVRVCDEDIPRPLLTILEQMWRENRIIVFPPTGFPAGIRGYLDPMQQEYGELLKFSQLSPRDLEKQVARITRKITKPSNRMIRIRSKIFEIIRIIPKMRYTPQMNYNLSVARTNPLTKIARSSPNVSYVKYVQEKKSIPPRKLSCAALFSELERIVTDGYECPATKTRLPIRNVHNSATLLESIRLVKGAMDNELGNNGAFSEFQMNSTLHVFLNTFVDDSSCRRWCNESACRLAKRNLAIVADTGAGKTYGFLMAPLINVAYKHLENPGFKSNQKPICVFIYPRVDLASNQHSVIKKLCDHISELSSGRVQISVGRDFAGTIEYRASIVTSNIEAVKRRLADPRRNQFIDPDYLGTVVLDELHLYSGILGLHMIYFMRRLGAFLKEKAYKAHHNWEFTYPIMVGASATIALPEEHARKLFSIGYEKRESVDRHRRIWVENAIRTEHKGRRATFHHVFMLPKRRANLIGTLVDVTVGTLHSNPDQNLRKFFDDIDAKHGVMQDEERNLIARDLAKSLLFMDTKSGISRTEWFIRDTEKRNLQVIDGNHNNINFTCNTTYDKPLKFLPKMYVCKGRRWFETPSLEEVRVGAFACNFCKRQEEFGDIALERYLAEGSEICSFEVYEDRIRLSNILQGCFLFRKGLCWWFSSFPFIDQHNDFVRENASPPDAITSFARTAESRDPEQDEELVSLFVKFGDARPYIRVTRLGVVSPVLEVGVDIPGVKDVLTFKAIKDLASYRQKTGRGGRETFSDIPVYTLITQRIIDRYVCRNPDIVADPSYLDPVPLKEHNTYFLRAHVFMAILDFLAIWSREYSDIYAFADMNKNPDLKKNELLDYLGKHENNLVNYLEHAFSYYATQSELRHIVGSAIQEFKDRVSLFFADLPANLQKRLGIFKLISQSVRRIDRRSLAELASRPADSEVLRILRNMLGVK